MEPQTQYAKASDAVSIAYWKRSTFSIHTMVRTH